MASDELVREHARTTVDGLRADGGVIHTGIGGRPATTGGGVRHRTDGSARARDLRPPWTIEN